MQPGYRRMGDACAAVAVPANAFLADSTYGSGWECARGFRLDKASCVAVRVPANGYLVRSGDDWKCDRGYIRKGGQLRAGQRACECLSRARQAVTGAASAAISALENRCLAVNSTRTCPTWIIRGATGAVSTALRRQGETCGCRAQSLSDRGGGESSLLAS